MRAIIAGAILAWIITIGYIPLTIILCLHEWESLQRATLAIASVLTIIAFHRGGGEYKMGYSRGWLDRDSGIRRHRWFRRRR
ncbi:hypothetical protein Skr01_36710 [Sphaerisporangium krabiense]|uniref:Uncharacterized protein n=1 Tax=Sphaerisporangium krabiense TaxID=763782 RepID=A0A7W8Z3D9_9ACTN|nr:hypothetical protein [Sphaerisporangium krabiense]MBB5626666.1 hypothetical protein [Sphaerisporangium krabiense]GII63586.1 hypothetical protein Skr01_36710 [Sphaerisporangium krabiense]